MTHRTRSHTYELAYLSASLISAPLKTLWSGHVQFSANGPWVADPVTLRADRKMKIEVTASGQNPFRIGVVSKISNGRNIVERMDQTDCANPKPVDHAHFECSLTKGQFTVVLANESQRENYISFEINYQ